MSPQMFSSSLSSWVVVITLALGGCSQDDPGAVGTNQEADALDAQLETVAQDTDTAETAGDPDASDHHPTDDSMTDAELDRSEAELVDRGRADLNLAEQDAEVRGDPDSALDSERADSDSRGADVGTQDADASMSDLHAMVDTSDVEADVTSDLFDGLNDFIQEKLSVGLIPGLGAAIVANGEVVWAEGFGWANVEEAVPATADTPFMLASVSKLITGTAVMQAVEAGAFAIDDPVNDLLPFVIDNPRVTGEVITVNHLVTHTSGIQDNWTLWGSLGDPEALYTFGDSEITLAYFMENFFVEGGEWYDANRNFMPKLPGLFYAYSNVGAALSGYLLETTTPLPLDDHSDEYIFDPLGMANTGWHLADFDPDLVAMPYGMSGEEWVPYGHFGYPDYPDGQLRTSARDMGRFMAAFANGGELDGVRILEEATVTEMFRPQLPEVEPTQGIIWYQYEFDGRQLIGHSGSDYGTATEAYLEPATGIGIVLLANVDWTSDSTPAMIEIDRRLFAVGDALSEP